MLKKINNVLRKIGIPLNVFNIVVGLLIGIAHVYLPLPSIPGLVLGIVMAVSGSAIIGIDYFFTSKNAAPNEENKQEPAPKLKNTKASNVFLSFFIPMIFLNSAACFFGMYTGVLLLAAALATPLAPAVIITIAVVLASILATGTLINSWLKIHNLWQSLKKPEPIAQSKPTPPRSEASKTIRQDKKYEVEKIPSFKKSIPQQISKGFSSFFSKKAKKEEPSVIPVKIQRRNSGPPRLG